MKRLLLTLALVVAVGAISFAVTRELIVTPVETHETWLQREFHLTARQLAAVEKLQADYEPVCADHCALVMQANKRLAANPADAAAHEEVRRLKKICFEATSKHLREVAAEMDAAQGRRFLKLMEPKLSGHDHAEPLDLK
ncbi:hypothetical protein [Oleiharenicola lentus]|uniref:hypothetical protein n=1 Tax=Oleiharenicola lentus TaxID=2508720 RepID=UPI003F6682AF